MKAAFALLVASAVLLSTSPAFAGGDPDHASDAATTSSTAAANPTTSSTAAARATTASSGPVHGAPGAKAGSHEDWCGEHEVPESQCTRCDKELIPAFKASSDWCAAHGLPESHCRACNPNLEIRRPSGGE